MGFATCDNICYTGLDLGLGGGYCSTQSNDHDSEKKKFNKKMVSLKQDHLFPRLSLGLPEDDRYQNQSIMQQQDSSNVSVTSFSNSSVKKERDQSGFGEQEVDIERAVLSSSRVSDEDEDGSPRKKLRLTKEQAAILEDKFTEHSTLNPKQKQALADQLNLRPRQVEVWFQNRRARTKLKQTEVDCELLKKCCETLTEENKRLQKELQELKSMKMGGALYMQMPAATLSMCPSCERQGGGGGGGGSGGGEAPSSLTKFTVATPPHFFSPFAHPSAAF